MQAFLLRILGPIFRSTPEAAALYEPDGPPAARPASCFACPSWATCSSGSGAEGPGFLYDGDVAAAVSDWVLERGGLLTRGGPGESYEVDRAPAGAARFRGREVLTNPPPSSGGILIADALRAAGAARPARATPGRWPR